jgi:hypothetical protein
VSDHPSDHFSDAPSDHVPDAPPDHPSGHVSDAPPDHLPDSDTQDLDRTAAHGPPSASVVQLDAPERRALEVLADQGLVPRLRLVATSPRLERPQSGHDDSRRDAG